MMRELEIEWFNAGRQTGEQFAFDLLILALSDSRATAGDRWGPKRLDRIRKALHYLEGAWSDVLNLYKFTDETRVLMDEQLQRVLGDKFTPFYDRYPYLRKTKEEVEIERRKEEKQKEHLP